MNADTDHDLNVPTVLVVDDTPTNIQVLFSLLDEVGYRVAIAKSGETALQRVEHHRPDLILLDVMMPGGIDGFETCQRLKAKEATRDIPIIFMTALSDTVDKVKGLRLGAVDYITKPIQHEEVLARMDVHLQLYRLNRNLEQVVMERTAALNGALEDLKNAQVQLVHGEKMSTLGQLVAGIAHEINNPINFIYGNFQPAKDYIEDLLSLVQVFTEEYPTPSDRVQEKMNAIDLEFLREDLPRLLHSMQFGTQRIRDLVLSLRNFSRLDESELKAVDLHEGLESTLLILQNRLKSKTTAREILLNRNYGNLPLVECYPGQLNQVFMNLLSNAIDALEERILPHVGNGPEDHQSPEIRIATQMVSRDRVQVMIEDNGPGIAPEVQSKIFDAFFTTKPMNKGTGLGLSISYQIIVDKHGGELRCVSRPGEGTQFVIELPLRLGSAVEHSLSANVS
ncbi:MAG: response regulator [Cyanobacteria bacterium]|nr:response regulator [Cyanobacteriota bacterium]